MKVCVLLSCMNQKDMSIVQKSNIQTDAVIINQCDRNSIEYFMFKNNKGILCNVYFINTIERGLSKSRNLAMQYAQSDICLICDDDEYLSDNYEDIISSAHQEMANVAVIAFAFIRKNVKSSFPVKKRKMGLIQICKICSIQITFKMSMIQNKNIIFDEKMGSGTKNGGGEEIKFMYDCHRKGLELYCFPQVITTLNEGDSIWFKGYTMDFFTNWGWSSRRIFGPIKSICYIFYVVIFKHSLYKENYSLMCVLKAMMQGWSEKR